MAVKEERAVYTETMARRVIAAVCCVLIVSQLTWARQAYFHFPDAVQLNMSDVLNKDCGTTQYEDRERPVEGRLEESPWLALLYYPDEKSNYCHGTLITPSHILTTAVCASNSLLNETMVVLGEYDVSTEIDCTGIHCADPVQRRKLSKIIVHDGYDSATFENDIAVLVLDQDVLISNSIRPICLPLIKFEVGEVNQPNVYNTLWATLPRPQQYWMRYVTLEECEQRIGHRINLVQGQICASSYYSKPIELAGGAGSALEVEYHNRMYQVGTLSVGLLDAEPGTPFVYVDVPKYIKWIHDTVKNN